ncbi:MAG: aminotransferase class IV [Nitriliruptorales bacterium]|nr:aminotransferase class IV [Nitriliruptorales bacterium]
MSGLIASVDGRFVAAADATVSVFDLGFRTGEGVFETFRSYGGHVFRLHEHLARAYDGARSLGFDPGPRETVAAAVTDTAERNLEALEGGDGVLRLTLTPGRVSPDSSFPGAVEGRPTIVVTAQHLRIDPAIYRDGIRAVRVAAARELPHVKALSYLAPSLARAEARRRGAAEALLIDDQGRVLEGATSNVFAVLARQMVTPALSEGILEGVTRSVVLERATELDLDVRFAPLDAELLGAADEVFVTATTREVVPVVTIDDEPVGEGTPGPVTARVHATYRDAVRAEREGR